MLKDAVTVYVQSGKGGAGSMAMIFDHANGGDGGAGGNVYVLGKANMFDLSWYDFGHKYKAENGHNGLSRHKSGLDGKDVVLELPLTTDVILNGKYLGTVSKDGQKEMILKGGKGSLGNISLKHESKDGYFDDIVNEVGEAETGELKLVFKLLSDVIFLGYPNAGKSSLLNELTNSHVKTANYAFTTLEPQLGMLDDIILMDLPGLIEGTHEGKGLGTKFVKHTESAKIMVHMVSLENEDPWAIYSSLRKELENIDPKLAAKPELVVLTKTDEATPETISKAVKSFSKHKIKTETVSIIDDEAIEKLKTAIKEKLKSIS